MITDLTQGKPMKLLLRFSLPLLVSVLFQQLYSMADSMIAGKMIGLNALSAIGVSFPVTMIFLAFGYGCNIGCSVVISNYFGAKDYKKTKIAIYTSLIGVIAAGLVLTVIGLILSRPLMTALNTPPEILEDALKYLNVFIGGVVFMMLYNVCNGICTALGDSKTPMIFLICSSAANVFMDIFFIGVLHMGVAGAAWATLICQGICSLLGVFVLRLRINQIHVPKAAVNPNYRFRRAFAPQMFLKISGVAIPSIMQQSFVSVGNILIQGLINGMGTQTIAGFNSAMRVNLTAISLIAAMGGAFSSYTAQNIGAGHLDRVKSGFKSSLILTAIISILFTSLILLFAPNLIKLFISDSTGIDETNKAIEAGKLLLQYASPFYIVVGLKLLADGALRGMREMTFFMIGTFSDLAIRVAVSFLLAPKFGEKGLVSSWPIGWVIGTAISVSLYLYVMHKRTHREGEIF
jgi:putative MATE family efflux protein